MLLYQSDPELDAELLVLRRAARLSMAQPLELGEVVSVLLSAPEVQAQPWAGLVEESVRPWERPAVAQHAAA